MAAVMVGLVALVLVVLVGVVANMAGPTRPSASRRELASTPDTQSRENETDELRRLRDAESEVERVSRETQEAIIRRAMWRAVWPMGGGSDVRQGVLTLLLVAAAVRIAWALLAPAVPILVSLVVVLTVLSVTLFGRRAK